MYLIPPLQLKDLPVSDFEDEDEDGGLLQAELTFKHQLPGQKTQTQENSLAYGVAGLT